MTVSVEAPQVSVRLYAAAAEALGAQEDVIAAGSALALRDALGARGEDAARVVPQCSLLRDGVRLDDEAALRQGDVVDVLPPFAGG